MTQSLTHPVTPPTYAKVERSEELYPVRRIFCVGRNYADHAREMGRDPEREAPFFFTKTADALVPAGQSIGFPPETSNFQYEMELVVALASPVFRAAREQTAASIFGFACGLDMTRRDRQLEARDQGRPWDVGKSFEESAVMGPLRRYAECGLIETGAIKLRVNGEVKQSGDVRDLIWPVLDIVAILSKFYRLGAGDLIFTGTPAGVGAVLPGDELVGSIEGLAPVSTTIVPCRS